VPLSSRRCFHHFLFTYIDRRRVWDPSVSAWTSLNFTLLFWVIIGLTNSQMILQSKQGWHCSTVVHCKTRVDPVSWDFAIYIHIIARCGCMFNDLRAKIFLYWCSWSMVAIQCITAHCFCLHNSHHSSSEIREKRRKNTSIIKLMPSASHYKNNKNIPLYSFFSCVSSLGYIGILFFRH